MAGRRGKRGREAQLASGPLAGREVVLGVTGSIAAYKAAELVRRLRERGAGVSVIMTDAARHFITPLCLQTLSGRPVAASMFEPSARWDIAHVELSELADLVIIAPATAATVARLAWGGADDLLSATVLGTRAPVLLAPAMSAAMIENPLFLENRRRLEQHGFEFVEAESGVLASGRQGPGRLAAVEKIVSRAEEVLESRAGDLSGLRFLVTAGPTREAIDEVRFISNPSSGRMGFALAARAARRGAPVRLVAGPGSLDVPAGVILERVTDASGMRSAVRKALPETDILVMAAAVANYRPARRVPGKIAKGKGGLRLDLEPTVDILGELAKGRRPRVRVGFAVEAADLLARARRKLKEKKLDLIVANSPDAFGADAAKVWILDAKGKAEELPELPKEAIADRVLSRAVELAVKGVRK